MLFRSKKSTLLLDESENYTIIENKFTIPLTFAEYLSIKNNPISQITFNRYNEQKKSGWIKSMNYDHDSQLAKFTIISTKNSLAN